MLNLDTHILLHSLSGGLRSAEASLIEQHRDGLGISAIVIWEIAMLAARKRISYDVDHPEIVRALSRLTIWPLDARVCARLRELDFQRDPADEIIAATSVAYSAPLLTRDERIRDSKIVPIAR